MSVPRRLEAADIRDEWLGWALSTLPADQTAAEAAISELYERAGRPAPRFLWVGSPNAAMEFVPAGIPMREFVKTLSIASRLATLGSELREALDRRVGHPWALAWGQGEPDPLDAEVRDPLRDFVRDGVCTPLRLALPLAERLTWYGQHDAYWIAHYDAWRRIGGRTFRGLNGQLDLWATLARSCGWWWPMEELCVVSLRPVSVRTEEQRLHSEQGPAVAYADGWSVHAWRGTRVPWWVIADPTPDRIAQEPNIEVRRCAIERLGWEAYIEQAGLRLVATARDPRQSRLRPAAVRPTRHGVGPPRPCPARHQRLGGAGRPAAALRPRGPRPPGRPRRGRRMDLRPVHRPLRPAGPAHMNPTHTEPAHPNRTHPNPTHTEPAHPNPTHPEGEPMTVNLATLSDRTGLAVLEHLERQVAIPVIEGIQAQGDLLVVPLRLVGAAVTVRDLARWQDVPATGLELLRGAAGGNPHSLVADPGTCTWTTDVRDTFRLALGVFHNSTPVYLLHPEHGATGFTPGAYVVRRQREFDHRLTLRGGGGHRLIAD
ncbi:DUF6745 domain-containing protein [Nonomuraea dietziae]